MSYLQLYLCLLVFVVFPESSTAQGDDDLPYTVKHGVIYCESGVPQQPRWFADSRLAFRFDDHGIAQVDYYSDVPGQNLSTLFLRQLWDGFRYFLELEKKTYKPEYMNSKVWPFGIESEWDFKGAIMKHRVMAVDESIVIQLTVPTSVPEGLRLKMEFFETFALTKGSADDLRFSNGTTRRKWDAWEFLTESNVLQGSVMSYPVTSPSESPQEPFQTLCLVGADFPMEHTVRPLNPKHILRSVALEGGKTYSFVISFGQHQSYTLEKHSGRIDSLAQIIERQFERYRRVAANSPTLVSPYSGLNNFISLAPMYHESLKITDHPGAMRAKTSNYWVWGWDGITSNEATAYWGDVAHIKDMLLFYEATADSLEGIGHAFNFDMKPNSISALPAQGMYISLLQLYYANTGDLRYVKERYPFAKTVFNRIATGEVAKTGFIEGTSLFPDFPVAMSETGDDISGFNNTIFYCAARSMEWLSALTGDKAQQKTAGDIIQRFESNFVRLFFNLEKKFVVSSLDSETLAQRDSYNTNAIRWENNYCADITDSFNAASLQFFKENSVTPMGLREIPLWNKSYDMDANQLHCWWPVTGEYFIRLANGNNERQLLDQWVGWVSYWIKHLTVPEGISYYIETDEPEFDRWTSQKGTWQGYSIRGWYQAAMHGVVGVGTDPGGITFYPYDGKEMNLTGLNFRNRKFDLEWKGTGQYIESIEANGTIIRGTNKLPSDLYGDKEQIKVVVNRVSENPYPIFVSTGTAIELRNYTFRHGVINADLHGAGFCRLKLISDRHPVVRLNGRKVRVIYDRDRRVACVELNLQPGKGQRIEIE